MNSDQDQLETLRTFLAQGRAQDFVRAWGELDQEAQKTHVFDLLIEAIDGGDLECVAALVEYAQPVFSKKFLHMPQHIRLHYTFLQALDRPEIFSMLCEAWPNFARGGEICQAIGKNPSEFLLDCYLKSTESHREITQLCWNLYEHGHAQSVLGLLERYFSSDLAFAEAFFVRHQAYDAARGNNPEGRTPRKKQNELFFTLIRADQPEVCAAVLNRIDPEQGRELLIEHYEFFDENHGVDTNATFALLWKHFFQSTDKETQHKAQKMIAERSPSLAPVLDQLILLDQLTDEINAKPFLKT